MQPTPARALEQPEPVAAPAVQAPRWSLWKAFWLAPWLPAATARHTATMPLPLAGLAPFLSAALTILVISVLTWLDWAEHPLKLIEEMAEEFGHNFEEASFVTVACIVSIELSLLVLALLVMPWGARDEAISASFRRALRQTWLHCAHAVPAVLIVGLAVVYYIHVDGKWSAQAGFRWDTPAPVPPTPPQNARAGTQAWKNYQHAQQQYTQEYAIWSAGWQAAWQEHISRQPFLVRYGGHLCCQLGIVATMWMIWSLLRAVAADCRVPLIERAPMCEACGYNLSGTPPDGRCPECGRSAHASLRADLRPGTTWERRGELGVATAYLKTIVETLRSPRTPGEQMSVTTFRSDHGLLLTFHLTIIFIIGLASTAYIWLTVFNSGRWGPSRIDILFGFAPVNAAIVVLIGLGWACLSAVVAGIHLRSKVGRNLAHPAIRVASHQSAWLVLWSIAALLQGIALVKLMEDQTLQGLADLLKLSQETIVLCCVAALNIVMGAWYLLLVWRGTAAARHANR